MSPRREHDIEAGHRAPKNDSRPGKLLYKLEEKETSWNGNIDRITLEFYEHVVLYRIMSRWCCFPKTKYYAEAVPRFKIVNVTFSNGRRNLLSWVLFLAVIGALILASSMLPFLPLKTSQIMRIAGIALLVASPVPLLFCSKWRYVTFDVKGLDSGRWFSRDKIYSFSFSKSKPDEDFIIDYVYGPLQKGCTSIHALSHYNSAALAAPFNSKVYTAMKTEDWILPQKEWELQQQQHRSGQNGRPRNWKPPIDDDEPEVYTAECYAREIPEDVRPSSPMMERYGTDTHPVQAQRLPRRHS